MSQMKALFFNFFFFNCFCTAAGIAILISTAIVVDWHEQVSDVFYNVTVLLPIAGALAVSCLIILITPLGILGAIKKSHLMVYSYPVKLLLFTISCFGIAIFIFGRQRYVETAADANIVSHWTQIPGVSNPFVDHMQQNLKCCGLNAITEWPVLPPSCCSGNPAQCLVAQAFTHTCRDALMTLIDDGAIITGAILFGAGGLMLITLIFSVFVGQIIGEYIEKTSAVA